MLDRSRPETPGRPADPAPSVGNVAHAVTGAAVAMALVALALFGLGLVVPAGAATAGSAPLSAPTSAAPTAGVLKYYIVGPPTDGRPEYLFDIAVRTLGSGRRYLEIFSLNEDRIQPDGGRLIDPAVLQPGWILILPVDAVGPSVHTGPLPTPAPAGALPSATRAAAVTGATDASGMGYEQVSRLVVFLVVAGIIVVAVRLLRRGQRLTMPGSPDRIRPRLDELAPADGPVPLRVERPAPPRVEVLPPRAEVLPEIRPPSKAATGRPAAAVSTVVGGPPWSPSAPPKSSPVTAGEVPEPHESVLEAEITLAPGNDTATVRLAGIRLQQSQPAWLWLDPDAARPFSPTVVALGSAGGVALCVDVAQAPDVVTLVGHLPGSRRLAASIAGQLSVAGVAVTVVGTAVGGGVTGVKAVDGLAEAVEAHPPTEPQVVFCGPTDDSDMATIRQLSVRSKPRTIVVLVGPERRSRWSIHVDARRQR